MQNIAVSVGDLNGIGIRLILENHHKIKKVVKPIYCIDEAMVKMASKLLKIPIPSDFAFLKDVGQEFSIRPSEIRKDSGLYSFNSFKKSIELATNGTADGILTLPIHKMAWAKAGIKYRGHTEMLRDIFDRSVIMMLGSPKMFVALYTEHIPLKEVASKIDENDLTEFLINFYNEIKPTSTVAVLGLNPHAGDGGILGEEEKIILKAINRATRILNLKNIKPFTPPLVPDIAFIPQNRKKYLYYVAIYHDQGLIPIKTLYFDEAINVSLNLPIKRVSVDHGTAFDIAYRRDININNKSYINAVEYLGG